MKKIIFKNVKLSNSFFINNDLIENFFLPRLVDLLLGKRSRNVFKNIMINIDIIRASGYDLQAFLDAPENGNAKLLLLSYDKHKL